jgi:hypothetical protein
VHTSKQREILSQHCKMEAMTLQSQSSWQWRVEHFEIWREL